MRYCVDWQDENGRAVHSEYIAESIKVVDGFLHILDKETVVIHKNWLRCYSNLVDKTEVTPFYKLATLEGVNKSNG